MDSNGRVILEIDFIKNPSREEIFDICTVFYVSPSIRSNNIVDLTLPFNYKKAKGRSFGRDFYSLKLNFYDFKLKNLPFQFGHSVDFDITHSDVTSLKGSPTLVDGEFNCSYTNITSLKYGPEIVTADYIISGNRLNSLEFLPRKIGGTFVTSNCFLRPYMYRYVLFSDIQLVETENKKVETLLNEFLRLSPEDKKL